MGSVLATKLNERPITHDLAPFPASDPEGLGFASVTLPLILGGIIPGVIFFFMFRGRRVLGLGTVVFACYSLVTGFAATAFLQYGTGSLGGNYWINALGLSFALATISMVVLGLTDLGGLPALGAAATVLLLLGAPLADAVAGPHWLPSGWGTLGQVLPPGAAVHLLRALAFFDGTGWVPPALTLAVWLVLGVAAASAAALRTRGPAADVAVSVLESAT